MILGSCLVVRGARCVHLVEGLGLPLGTELAEDVGIRS